MDPFYPDPDGMLSHLCQLCAIPFHTCIHATAPYAAARMLYHEPQSFHPPLPDLNQTAVDLSPIVAYVAADVHQQLLMTENVRHINADETAIQPVTVQAHIEDTYTPGDRLDENRAAGARRSPHRRQAPRLRGYPCNSEGCERTFDRACELNRHRKTHLGSSERPHQCNICHEGFLYPKDLVRHQKKHIEHRSAQMTFFCSYPGCNNAEGFSRRDNLLRHQRKQHRAMAAAA